MGYSDFHSFRRLFLFSPNPALIHSKLKESLRNHVTNFPAASRFRRFIAIDIDRLWHFLHLEFKYFIAVVPCKKPLPSCTPHRAVTQINRSCKAVSAWFLGRKKHSALPRLRGFPNSTGELWERRIRWIWGLFFGGSVSYTPLSSWFKDERTGKWSVLEDVFLIFHIVAFSSQPCSFTGVY